MNPDTPEGTKLVSMGYREGLIDGVRRYAWWRDGVQYCGTTGNTLASAIAQIKKECEDPNYRQPY
jgi:hypothetical protein